MLIQLPAITKTLPTLWTGISSRLPTAIVPPPKQSTKNPIKVSTIVVINNHSKVNLTKSYTIPILVKIIQTVKDHLSMILTQSHQEWEKWTTMSLLIDKPVPIPKPIVVITLNGVGVNQLKENLLKNTIIFQMSMQKPQKLGSQREIERVKGILLKEKSLKTNPSNTNIQSLIKQCNKEPIKKSYLMTHHLPLMKRQETESKAP